MGEISRVLQGAKSPLSWLHSGRGPVPHDQATSRAATCLTCPKNGYGPLTQWFTEPAAALIKAAIEARVDFKLETPYDAALGVCEACFCPLKTKVHQPLDLVISGMSPKSAHDLWENCWIRNESPKPPRPYGKYPDKDQT